MAAVSHPPITADEYDALMAAAGWRAPLERLGGEVVVMPPIGGRASAVALEFTYALRGWQEGREAAGLLLADVPLLVGEHRPVPDLSWWREGRRPPVGEGAVASVPDLVVEILSPRTRDNDLGVKRDIYTEIGVQEYWRVEPTENSVAIDRRTGEALHDLPLLTGADRLTTPLLEGFELGVGSLFAIR